MNCSWLEIYVKINFYFYVKIYNFFDTAKQIYSKPQKEGLWFKKQSSERFYIAGKYSINKSISAQ